MFPPPAPLSLNSLPLSNAPSLSLSLHPSPPQEDRRLTACSLPPTTLTHHPPLARLAPHPLSPSLPPTPPRAKSFSSTGREFKSRCFCAIPAKPALKKNVALYCPPLSLALFFFCFFTFLNFNHFYTNILDWDGNGPTQRAWLQGLCFSFLPLPRSFSLSPSPKPTYGFLWWDDKHIMCKAS